MDFIQKSFNIYMNMSIWVCKLEEYLQTVILKIGRENKVSGKRFSILELEILFDSTFHRSQKWLQIWVIFQSFLIHFNCIPVYILIYSSISVAIRQTQYLPRVKIQCSICTVTQDDHKEAGMESMWPQFLKFSTQSKKLPRIFETSIKSISNCF